MKTLLSVVLFMTCIACDLLIYAQGGPAEGVIHGIKTMITRIAMKGKAIAMKLLWATMICIIIEVLVVEHISYIPKSQRNLTSKAIKRAFRHGQNVIFEQLDRYNWAKARSCEPDHSTLAQSALCYEAKDYIARREREVHFDTDSTQVGIDNRCTGCISHVASDFIGELVESDVAIKGFAGAITRRVMTGTLRWKWTDDDGMEHKFLIPNSFYVPHGGVRLLSPQHWAQTQRDRRPMLGTGEWTDAEKCVLYWKQKRYKKTIYLDTKRSNVATMRLAPGYHKFSAFCTEVGIDSDIRYEMDPIIAEPAEISDDEESITEPEEGLGLQEGETPTEEPGEQNETKWKVEEPRKFDLAGHTKQARKKNPVVIVDEEDRTEQLTPTTELLLYHYRFGHISFNKLQWMARLGILPKRLAKCNVPACSACLYAKATKRPWRAKTRHNEHPGSEPLKPGDVVSVDQMVSPVPGLIAHLYRTDSSQSLELISNNRIPAIEQIDRGQGHYCLL